MGTRAGGSATILTALLIACAPPPPVTDAEKQARLAEMVADVDERFPSVRQVTVAEIGRLLEKDSVVLVDVREDRERAVSVIPGAITAAEYERDRSRYADVAVVAYCTIGHRSSEYAERLTGPDGEVWNLSGSILAWARSGGPLVGPEGPTRQIHVYGRSWDLAPEGYETTW